MSDITYIGRRMREFQSAPEHDGFTKVVIKVSDDVEYSAGVETGRTMTLENPWGTQQMADNILKSIGGFQYQPYTATDSILDPAAELGDGITANNVYGGIYTMSTKFGGLCRATVAAPEEDKINHEFPYVEKKERRVKRNLRVLTAELKIQAGLISAEVAERKSDVESINSKLTLQAGLIEAKVSKTGGSPSSFGWTLDDASWTIKANGSDILKATKAGLEVYGKITATSGKIGGFAIEANHLSYNNQTWGGTNSKGIYIGPSGIQLGKYFKVDSNGNLTASSGRFTGTVHAGRIAYGEDEGYLSGSGISSGSIYGNRLKANTVSTAYTSGGINTSLGRADAAYNICTGVSTAKEFIAKELKATEKASVKEMYIGGNGVKAKSVSFKDQAGNTVHINYWGWS